MIAKLEHCNDCDEAQAYIGSEITVEQDQFEAVKDKNAYYWREIVGLLVINQQNNEQVVVKKLLETNDIEVLLLTKEEKAEKEKY